MNTPDAPSPVALSAPGTTPALAPGAPDVSIIIVSWNVRDMLARSLRCIFQTVRRASYEVLVVDNASADGSAAMVRDAFPQVTLIANGSNLGFGQANNQAAALARGRYLLLLNPDAFAHEGAIDELVAFMDAHPEAGASGCRLYYEDGSLQSSVTSFPTVLTELWTTLGLDRAFPAHPVFGSYVLAHERLGHVQEVDSLMGAFLMLRASAVARVGLFDERFFMYSEEVDLCYRLRRAGWRNYFVPQAEATHVWGGSAWQIQGESFLRIYRSRFLFFRKHYGPRDAAAYKAILLLAGLLRLALGPIAFALSRERDYLRIYQNYLALLRALPTLDRGYEHAGGE